jgi:hypothetical protein
MPQRFSQLLVLSFWSTVLAAQCLAGPARASDVGTAYWPNASTAAKDVPAPQPTGDALWDRYSAEVYRRALQTPLPWPANFHPALPPDYLLQQWTDLVADPRYWELRFLCALATSHYCAEHGSASDQLDQDLLMPLRDAMESATVIENRGEASLRVRLLNIELAYSGNQISFFDLYRRHYMVGLWGRQKEIDDLRRAAGTWEVNERASLERLLAQYPEQRWAELALAEHYYNFGDTELARLHLSSALSKADDSLPIPYPVSLMFDQAIDQGNAYVLSLSRDALYPVIQTRVERCVHDMLQEIGAGPAS